MQEEDGLAWSAETQNYQPAAASINHRTTRSRTGVTEEEMGGVMEGKGG